MRALVAIGCLSLAFVAYGSPHGSPQSSARFDPASVLSTVETLYPPRSVASGTVILEVGVDTEGKVADVRVVHDIPSLTESAQVSVRQWKFEPARVDGRPVNSRVTTAFTFVQPVLGPTAQPR